MGTYGDLVRALARDDVLIAADVRRRLCNYAGFGHWQITVAAGEVILIGEESDSVQRHTAQLIAEAVIGVTAVRFADPAIAG